MTNTYRLRLNGCGEQDTKEIDLELTAADARRLAEWDLGGLDCCGGPMLYLTPVKAGATYGTGILREDNDG